MHLIPVNFFGLLFLIIYDGWLSIITSQTVYTNYLILISSIMDGLQKNVTGGSKGPVQQGSQCRSAIPPPGGDLQLQRRKNDT